MIMTKICIFSQRECSVESFLREDLHLSRQSLKKNGLTKNFLQKKVQHGDELEIPIDLLNKDLVNPVYRGAEIEILYHDEQFLVVDKPVGVHGHPLRYSDQENVLSFLRANGYSDVPSLAYGGQEKGLLYRLDLETSGVLVGCKNEKITEEIRTNFDSHVLLKRYLCIVKGVGPKNGVYHFALESFGPQSSRVRVSQKGEGVNTQTILQKISEENGLSLFQVDLKTGARHQIRAVFQALGYPLLGDILYQGEKAERLFLHANEYRIQYNGKIFSFQSFPRSFSHYFLDLDRLLKMVQDETLISKS